MLTTTTKATNKPKSLYGSDCISVGRCSISFHFPHRSEKRASSSALANTPSPFLVTSTPCILSFQEERFRYILFYYQREREREVLYVRYFPGSSTGIFRGRERLVVFSGSTAPPFRSFHLYSLVFTSLSCRGPFPLVWLVGG
jgi:hypothetical protein